MKTYSLEGRVALVTGSSKGIGEGIARVLASNGAKVVINACNDVRRAKALAEELNAAGHCAAAVGADVTTARGIRKLVARTEKELGPVDILAVNATGPQPQHPIEKYSEAFYQEMYDFFVKSPFLLTQAVVAGMKERKWGRIVNITSEVFAVSLSNFSGYVAAKGGQIGWSRSMSRELAPFGITVNMVAPGWIPTERHADVSQDAKDGYLATVPVGRWGTPEDIGHAVAFFASEEASFVTGQTLHVNGGNTPW